MARSSVDSGTLVASGMFFREMNRNQTFNKGFHMLLSGGVNRLTQPTGFKAQTLNSAPIVLVNDLETKWKDSGATSVRLEMIHDVRGMPVTGDEDGAGTEEEVTSSYFDITVERLSKPLKTQGVMGELRKNYKTETLLRPALNDWGSGLQSEMALFHMAGARGDYYDAQMSLATAAHPKFVKAMTNPVLPPTYDRHFYAGNATSVATIDATDVITRATFQRLRYAFDTDPFAPERIMLSGEEMVDDSKPSHIVLLSPAQWKGFQASEGTAWDALVASARARASGWDHPVFKQEGFLCENFWVCKNFLPVRFLAGTAVPVSANDDDATAGTSTVANGVTVDRALILGGSALGIAYAAAENGRNFMFKSRAIGYDRTGVQISFVAGMKKIRFRDAAGRMRDKGVAVLDSAVTL